MADNSSGWMDFSQRSREEGGLGLERHQASGLVGNLKNESGQGLDPWGVTGDNGTAWGTAQWRGDRLENLKAHAATNGADHRSVEAQQAFMRHEFDGLENRSYKALLASKTPEEAATAVNTRYERSADRSGNRERSARQLYDGTSGPTAIEAAMGRRSTGSQPMAYADTNTPALSPQVPPGALQAGGQPVVPDKWAVFGQMLKDMAPGIAQDPAHAQVLEASAAAGRPKATAAGTWSQSIDPKTGVGTMIHSSTGQTRSFQAHAPQKESEGKWGVVGKDKFGGPLYGYPPTQEAYAASKAAPEAAATAADAEAAMSLSGKPFMDQLGKDKGTGHQSQVQAIIEGRAPYPTGAFLKTPLGQQIAQDVTQADPGFETGNATSRVKVRNEFKAGGPSSPAGQITAGNTALQHAGEMSDALEKHKGNGNDYEGLPFISYYMNKGHNASIAGTKAGVPLSEFNTARDHFAEEVTKFYSGSTGSEGERKRALDNLDAAKSLPELRAAVAYESKLMHGKVNALQERWKTGMGPLVPEFDLIHPESKKAIDRIHTRNSATNPDEGAPVHAGGRRPLSDIFK